MKLRAIEDVPELLGGVHRVALGGMLLENRPSTLVRALVRSSARELFVTSAPAASWDLDILIGAGAVTTVRVPHISLGSLGFAPAARQAAEQNSVQFEECDEAILLGGYLAASANSPIQVLAHLGTNDVVDQNPLLISVGDLVGVAPLRVDVALLHAPIGDEHGNLGHYGSRWADLLIARAADTVIAQVDRIVPAGELSDVGVSIPGYLVDHIVEAPFGAHPLGSVGSYVADLSHLRSYIRTVLSGGMSDYLAEYCLTDHSTYLDLLEPGLMKTLVEAAS